MKSAGVEKVRLDRSEGLSIQIPNRIEDLLVAHFQEVGAVAICPSAVEADIVTAPKHESESLGLAG